jgi:hypothetical protein
VITEPVIIRGREVGSGPLNCDYSVVLLTDIVVPEGAIAYAHIMAVLSRQGPVGFVTAEWLEDDIYGGDPRLALGYLASSGHVIVEESDEIADVIAFRDVALVQAALLFPEA